MEALRNSGLSPDLINELGALYKQKYWLQFTLPACRLWHQLTVKLERTALEGYAKGSAGLIKVIPQLMQDFVLGKWDRNMSAAALVRLLILCAKISGSEEGWSVLRGFIEQRLVRELYEDANSQEEQEQAKRRFSKGAPEVAPLYVRALMELALATEKSQTALQKSLSKVTPLVDAFLHQQPNAFTGSCADAIDENAPLECLFDPPKAAYYRVKAEAARLSDDPSSFYRDALCYMSCRRISTITQGKRKHLIQIR